MNPRPCVVAKRGEDLRYGKCHGFGFKAWTHGAAVTIGGFTAGQESYAVAIVEFNDGHIEQVPVEQVTMIQEE